MFDLSAYLARVRLAARPACDSDGLAALQRAHRLAIPFESLGIALGRGIRIDSDNVFSKLVTARRGGYCFEQNRLFLDALSALGFEARSLLARVWLAAEGTPPLTHTLSLVRIDGREWIADAGFGGSYAPPMLLADGAAATAPDGARFRLTRDAAHGWMLLRDGDPATTDGRDAGTGWRPQFSFTTDTVFDSDLAMGNHWTSTHPASRFVQHRIVSLVLPDGLARMTNRDYRRWTAITDDAGEIADPHDYRTRLNEVFGISLDEEEVARLGLFA
jgi:N-hydroxyarylamine O-acetyltransferase